MFILTNGGPYNATEVINTFIYKTVFSYNDLGLGSAMANMVLLLLVAIALIRSYFNRRYSLD